MIKVNGQYFEIIEEYRACFEEETFANRYSDILDKYDFIVGDFGYDQLEYCNFGCPYLILRRIPESEIKTQLDESETTESDAILEEDKLHDVKIQPSIQQSEK